MKRPATLVIWLVLYQIIAVPCCVNTQLTDGVSREEDIDAASNKFLQRGAHLDTLQDDG